MVNKGSPVVQIRLEQNLLDRIDEVRGKIPRSVWIRTTVAQKLGESVPRETPARGPLPAPPPESLKAGEITAPGAMGPPESAVPPTREYKAARAKAIPKDEAACPHPYRNPSGRCFICGHQR